MQPSFCFHVSLHYLACYNSKQWMNGLFSLVCSRFRDHLCYQSFLAYSNLNGIRRLCYFV
ncbi:hypothetical protein OIU77_013071 [Salix suchowensis]|uniref:Uncharacterized protein n=1 Tax=Salix suchowensis TaxID=1278906 RepID=A0ABQ8ZTA8_9ROSI|nr:hypothetical protein OIU77_013071 [Salix suchowensis]